MRESLQFFHISKYFRMPWDDWFVFSLFLVIITATLSLNKITWIIPEILLSRCNSTLRKKLFSVKIKYMRPDCFITLQKNAGVTFIAVKLFAFVIVSLHEKWSFPFRISSAKKIKSAVSCKFGQIYWQNF